MDDSGHFMFCFMAFGASIEGWKYCKPIISVDGTFLKCKFHYKKSGFFRRRKTSGKVKNMSGKDLPTQSSASEQTSGEVSRDRLSRRCVGHALGKPLSTETTTSEKPRLLF
ncbi:protein FAR1-RELATED SEQUENCE 2-like [Cucumis melo var. makuwa]|uniref:Protein FAR1-RELATED SEQUENCE 2-like n=1 Tax=Cucumis melo var. makuwa TaxID=1194695 RepID=A0A5D3BF39_CUCMM|nr:protein FAR1-RELATED SEQUENCE 2-like [Cucumis melo var. makuwa]TYJ97659.1 protein FAR1-RELATED SEQUENCE 2-like [Cucumis melo var. makuwa]